METEGSRVKHHAPDITWTHVNLDFILRHVPNWATDFLDVGCGMGLMGAIVKICRPAQKIIGIEYWEPYLQFCEGLGVYTRLIKHDLRRLPLPLKEDEKFDVALVVEVLEHLPKKNGLDLLKELEKLATVIVVSTPRIFYHQARYNGNELQDHVSLWRISDFKHLGYIVRGGSFLNIASKRLPFLSDGLARATYRFPQFSENIIAVKTHP